MTERVLQFGAGRRLMGTLTLPPGEASSVAPAVLIPNTGLDHRVGPNRLHVILARSLADAGFPVLRMDLSGMGDSRRSPRGDDALADQQAALDELTRLGVADRFVAFGICSGGHDAHRLTVADRRVVAAGFVDHYAYPTPGSRRRYWRDRLLDPRRLNNLLRRVLRRTPTKSDLVYGEAGMDFFSQPDRATFGADLQSFMARKLSLFFLYTGEMQAEYNYRNQLVEGFPMLGDYPRLTVHLARRSDHTFTLIDMRRELVGLVGDWLKGSEFG